MVTVLSAVTLAIAAMFQSAPDRVLAEPTSDPDARIMSDLFFRYIPEGTVADCLVTFTYDTEKTESEANRTDLGDILYQAVFDFAQNDDFRAIGQMRGHQRNNSYIFPSDCGNTATKAQAIADRANMMQSEIHIVLTAPDAALLAEIGDRPMWDWEGFKPDELRLREAAMASPCRPDGWRDTASWYLTESRQTPIDQNRKSDLLNRAKLMSALGDVLAGGDMSQTVSSAYGSAEEQAFVKAMLEVQLSATECD
jgi:hypothetical protein